MTSRTFTGPAAWRNVPQVVAIGKTRLVTRNVSRLRGRHGRSARPRACHGSASESEQRDREARAGAGR